MKKLHQPWYHFLKRFFWIVLGIGIGILLIVILLAKIDYEVPQISQPARIARKIVAKAIVKDYIKPLVASPEKGGRIPSKTNFDGLKPKPRYLQIHPEAIFGGNLGVGISVVHIWGFDLDTFYIPQSQVFGIGVTYPIRFKRNLFIIENLRLGIGYNFNIEKRTWIFYLTLPL